MARHHVHPHVETTAVCANCFWGRHTEWCSLTAYCLVLVGIVTICRESCYRPFLFPGSCHLHILQSDGHRLSRVELSV